MTVVRFAEVPDAPGCGDGPAPRWMTAPEAARRSRIVHAADRAAYDAAHLLVRECAGELLGCEAQGLALAQLCPTCGSEAHGMPRMIGSPVHVSLSHTRGYVAAIASWSRCGIDVERAGAPVIRRALGDDEARWVAAQRAPGDAFVMLWTRKEALVKAGLGALERVHLLNALRPVAGARIGDWRGGSDGAVYGSWCVLDERLSAASASGSAPRHHA
ncbi:4'-phosphopantetheinyl transferase family protein [Leucobacter celer]|uniref:4'-phosphopantetheinyl transferase family protein n=1 Tax=Leucobacter celer TaxID=668625 RepID=UPI0006A7A3BA|nr:4'-phosphopantetheinyl transferase superfamily protein [Leucobacter celer]